MRCCLALIDLDSQSMSCSGKSTADLIEGEIGLPPSKKDKSELSTLIEMIPPCQSLLRRVHLGKGISPRRERTPRNRGVASLSNKPRQLFRRVFKKKEKKPPQRQAPDQWKPQENCRLCGQANHWSQNCRKYSKNERAIAKSPCRMCNEALYHYSKFCHYMTNDPKKLGMGCDGLLSLPFHPVGKSLVARVYSILNPKDQALNQDFSFPFFKLVSQDVVKNRLGEKLEGKNSLLKFVRKQETDFHQLGQSKILNSHLAHAAQRFYFDFFVTKGSDRGSN